MFLKLTSTAIRGMRRLFYDFLIRLCRIKSIPLSMEAPLGDQSWVSLVRRYGLSGSGP
jgi:hypothetical protein